MQQKTQQILTWTLLALLILWGGYTFFYFLGMPVHRASLLTEAASTGVDAACQGAFCQGLYAFFPFLSFLLTRLQPFLWYGILSVIIFGAFAVYQWMRTGGTVVRLKMKPWHVGLLFLGSLWLLFTTFSARTVDGFPMKRIVEPTSAVYNNVNDATLKALRDNFDMLQSRGCLTQIGEATGGAGLYDIKGLCTQRFFIERVLSQVAVMAGLLFLLLIAGHTVLGFMRIRKLSVFSEGLLSVGLGAGIWMGLLWLLATLGAYSPNVGWSLIIAVLVLCYKSAWDWLMAFLHHEWEVEIRLYDPVILVAFLLVSYLALNFLVVVRPFPIGWDDLGSYINRPRLLVSYGHIIPSMATFQWEYLTSLGFLLFGYNTYFGATAAMIINWSEGLLALLSVWLFGRTFMGPKKGLLSALVFYTLPLIGHFSFADMKIDNAVFFMGALTAFATFLALFHTDHDEDPATPFWNKQMTRLLFLAGIFAGISFGIKVTSIMVVLAVFIAILGMGLGHWYGGVIGACIAVGLLAMQGSINLQRIVQRLWAVDSPVSITTIGIIVFVIAAAISAYAVQKSGRTRAVHTLLSLCVFLGGFVVSCVPWLAYNNIRNGRVIPGLALSYSDPDSPSFDLTPKDPAHPPPASVHYLPKELELNNADPTCGSTSMAEELDRYWGHSQGWKHYAFLPWRNVMNEDTGGYYVTTIPALLLFPLLLLLPYFWDPKAKWLRYLWCVTLFIVVEWTFLANGVPWYGVGMFLGLTLVLEALHVYAPNRTTRYAAVLLIILSVLTAFGMRLWQFEQQQNLLEYPMGKIDGNALEQRTIPYYNDIANMVVQRHNALPKQPFVYRVGTFIPYFVPKNLEILAVADHQLDMFNCINQERNPELTLKRLIALGFNSVIFDTNTATIERESNGTLHKKVDAFVNFLNTPNLGTRVLVNDINAGIAFILLPPIQ